eukprot:5259406-Amphidinium_carterae.2
MEKANRKVGQTAPNYWWKGQTCAIDQHAAVTELPTSGPSVREIYATTTTIVSHELFGTTNCSRVKSINVTLALDDQYKCTNAVRQWAVLIDTGAITSVAPRHHFSHIPLQQLQAEDPQSFTSVNGECQIFGIQHVTMIHNNVAIPTIFIITDVTCEYSDHGYETYI